MPTAEAPEPGMRMVPLCSECGEPATYITWDTFRFDEQTTVRTLQTRLCERHGPAALQAGEGEGNKP